MDIIEAEKLKKYIRMGVAVLRKLLGRQAKPENIHKDLSLSGNPIAQYLSQLINITADQIEDSEWQERTIRQLGELGVWLMVKDTGYRPMFFWALDKMLDDHEKLKEMIAPYVQEPNEWYCNVWQRTKKNSKKFRKKGHLPKYAVSPDEEIFIPSKQEQKLKKIK